MGSFDSYNIAWGDSAEQVQTKQLDSSMLNWKFGERVPLAGLDFLEQDAHSNFSHSSGLPPGCDSFRVLIEDSILSNNWSNPSLSNRHFVFGHIDGIFADYSAAMNVNEAEELSIMMRTVWKAPDTGLALLRQFRFIQERNTQALLSLKSALSNIDPLYRDWRKHLVNQSSGSSRVGSEIKLPKPYSFIFDHYYGPDFSQLSRLAVTQGLHELCSGWELSLMDFGLAVEPILPQNRAQEVALECAQKHARAMLSTGSLGAPNPADISLSSEPAKLTSAASPQRALELLRRGLWRLFELDACELTTDANFVRSAQRAIEQLCASRIGSFWAAGFIARNPIFNFGHVRLCKTDIPLIDWMTIYMGLPTRLVAPLIEIGAALSPVLVHHCLQHAYSPLLNLLLLKSGGIAQTPARDGVSLVVQAARCSSLEALKIAQAEGLLHPNSPDTAWVVKEAYDAEIRSTSWLNLPSDPAFFANPEPPSLACAVYLHELSLPFPGPLSERLHICLSMREKQSLSEIVAQAPTSSKPQRI